MQPPLALLLLIAEVKISSYRSHYIVLPLHKCYFVEVVLVCKFVLTP